MRLFVSGSAPLPATVFEAFRAKFGHAILERYGMTETLMTIGNPYDGERRPGTVGRPLPGVEVRIVGPDGRDVPEGETGELLVRGPAVFDGYWRQPEATAAAFVDGWFRTGDLGERSADGYVTLRGRASDLIISGGFNVYPREIEDVLLEQPGVREAAVVGVPDARRGEVPVACFAGDADPAALEAACRRLLASFKVPRSFVRVDALPRNAMGKVDKGRLREALAKRDARSRSQRTGIELVPARLRRRVHGPLLLDGFVPGGERVGRRLERRVLRGGDEHLAPHALRLVPAADRPLHRVGLPPHRRAVAGEVHALRELGVRERADRLAVDLQLEAAGGEAGHDERLPVEALDVGPGLLRQLGLGVLEAQRQRQRAVELRPGEAAARRREAAHLRVLGRDHRLRRRVDLDAGHERRGVPGPQQRRAHDRRGRRGRGARGPGRPAARGRGSPSGPRRSPAFTGSRKSTTVAFCCAPRVAT